MYSSLKNKYQELLMSSMYLYQHLIEQENHCLKENCKVVNESVEKFLPIIFARSSRMRSLFITNLTGL